MKISITLLALVIFFSCKNDSNVAPKIVKSDTVNTIVGYVGYQKKGSFFDEAKRITTDSLTFKWNGDSTVATKKWSKVTYYLVHAPAMTDSLLASIFKIPQFDSTGKPYRINIPMHLEPKYVVDGITDLDSARRYLSQFIIKDTSIIKK